MVAGAALEAAPVIRPAGVGGGEIGAAHGEQRTAAVAALQKAGVHVVVDLHAAIVAAAALFPQRAGDGEGAVVDDGLMVVLDDDVLIVVALDVPAVDLGAGVLALTERADIEIVIQNALHRGDGPGVFGFPFRFLARRLLAHPLGHARRGNTLIGEVVGDFLVAPTGVAVEVKNPADGLGFGGDDLKLLVLGDKIAVGRGADPLAIVLPPLHNAAHLAGGVRDGHFVHKKLELDFQPVVVIGEIHAVADGDDAHARVTQVFQLYKAAAVAAGKAGKVLDDENVVFVAHQPPAHLLIALALLERVAGAVAVFKKRQRAAGEVGLHIVLDDGLLVLDGDVFLILLIIHGNAGIARDVKAFNQFGSPPFKYFSVCRSNSEMYAASCIRILSHVPTCSRLCISLIE